MSIFVRKEDRPTARELIVMLMALGALIILLALFARAWRDDELREVEKQVAFDNAVIKWTEHAFALEQLRQADYMTCFTTGEVELTIDRAHHLQRIVAGSNRGPSSSIACYISPPTSYQPLIVETKP